MNISLEYYKVFYNVAKLGSISAAANSLFISQPAVSQAIKHLETALDARLFNRTSNKVFYNVAKLGSISAAANSLFISQPAVSQAIKHLETALDARLFNRTSKGVRLTPEGEALYNLISQGYDYFLRAENMFRDIHALQAGEIRIGASDMTLQYYLLPYLESFHSRYPKVKIRVTNGPTPETVKALRAGEIDFGIVTTPVISDKWMTVTPVRKIQDCFVAGIKFIGLRGKTLSLTELAEQPLTMLEKKTSSRRYIDNLFVQEGCFVAGIKFIGLRGKTLSLTELAEQPLTMLEKKTSSRRYIDNLFVQEGCVVQPEFELATSDLIVQFALRGLGIGYVTQDFAQPYLDGGQLFKLQLSDPIARRSMCLITPTQFPMPLAAKRLINEELRDEDNAPILL